MDQFIELAKILLPSILIMYAMYLTIRSFLRKEFERKLIDLRTKNTEMVLPLRLQAYERMCIFLERISPANLFPRVNQPMYTADEFRHILVKEVREEFAHNLSQQIYMSDVSWQTIRQAMEEIILLINQSAENLKETDSGLDLTRIVFEKIIHQQLDPTALALKIIKDEIRVIF
jgi:hypothetical protein